jgi:hypothetical protein
MIVVDYLAICF